MKKSLRPLGLFLYLALCYAAAYALFPFSRPRDVQKLRVDFSMALW